MDEPETKEEDIDLIKLALKDPRNEEGINIRIATVVSGELLNLPRWIRKQGEHMVLMQSELDAVKLRIKNWELTEMQDITAQTYEVGEKNKPTFSNESARKAELENRKDTHSGYGEMETDHKKMRMAVEYGKVEYDFLRDRYRGVRAIALMFAGLSNRGTS